MRMNDLFVFICLPLYNVPCWVVAAGGRGGGLGKSSANFPDGLCERTKNKLNQSVVANLYGRRPMSASIILINMKPPPNGPREQAPRDI